jgi:hypothetical protein
MISYKQAVTIANRYLNGERMVDMYREYGYQSRSTFPNTVYKVLKRNGNTDLYRQAIEHSQLNKQAIAQQNRIQGVQNQLDKHKFKSTITDVVKKATELGLSYGEYVQRYLQ